MARIKLSAAQALQLIQQLGVDAELVADDQAAKDLKFDDAIAAVDESRGKILRPDIETELREQLTTSLAGKFGGDLRAHLRRLSNGQLKTSDLKDLKDDEAIQKFLDVMVGQKDQSLEDIRNQQKTALTEWETEKAKIIADKDREYTDLKQKYTERDIDSILETALNDVPRIGGDLKTQAQLAKSFLRGKYKDHYDENKKAIEIRDLTNPEKIALNGNVAVQLNDVLTEFAKNTGILKTDMRGEDPNKVIKDQEGGKKHETTIIGGSQGDVKDAIQSLESQLANI